ncbi:hypothetical protein pipiens_006796 [Culex pipiens pipiens]|uniref:TIL domain-containing protein n=1 Tax=Culex pipiens pipiens TaxID=38569 RepID=A0ABD1DN59_CULPP
MKVTIVLLVLAVVAITAVNCYPKDCCGPHEERAPCGPDCPKPCDGHRGCSRPCKCVCIKGYHRNHEGQCVPDCDRCGGHPGRPYPYPSKDESHSSSSSSSEESKEH